MWLAVRLRSCLRQFSTVAGVPAVQPAVNVDDGFNKVIQSLQSVGRVTRVGDILEAGQFIEVTYTNSVRLSHASSVLG